MVNYELTVKPGMLTEGEVKGYLECVNYEAVGEDLRVVHKMWSVNEENLIERFSKLVPMSEAITALTALRAGRTVTFSGLFTTEELTAYGFQYLS